ncbi:MAG: hypothetical protein ACJ768_19620 [Gaiellaceae bacterium]
MESSSDEQLLEAPSIDVSASAIARVDAPPRRAPELAQRDGWPTIGELSPDAWPALGLREVPADPRAVDVVQVRAYCPRCRLEALGSELVDLRVLTAAQLAAIGLASAIVCTQCLRFLNVCLGVPLGPISTALRMPAAQQAALIANDDGQVRLAIARPMRSLKL